MNKSKKITFYVCAGIIVVFLYFKYGIVTPAKPTRTQRLKLNSLCYLEYLGKEIMVFMKNHEGARPLHLSCLLPTNSVYDINKIFRVPQSEVSHDQELFDSVKTNKYILDEICDYVLPTNHNPDILIHERPGLWSDRSVAVYIVGRGAVRVSYDEFKKIIAQDDVNHVNSDKNGVNNHR